MNLPTYGTTADFDITFDRAGHLVVTRSHDGKIVDLGTHGKTYDTVYAWAELGETQQIALSPAVNIYLHGAVNRSK